MLSAKLGTPGCALCLDTELKLVSSQKSGGGGLGDGRSPPPNPHFPHFYCDDTIFGRFVYF